MQIKKGYTHAGEFHTDDVISTVLLQKLFPEIQIERIYEVERSHESEDSIIYDIGLGAFDHHQEDRLLNDNGTPYAAFGLLWEAFGKRYLKQFGFRQIDEAFSTFKQTIVEKINIGDNKGYRQVKYFYENDMIKNFNPKWYEVKQNPDIYQIQFEKAVSYGHHMFDNWMRDLYEKVEYQTIEADIFTKAVGHIQNGLIILEENIPWQKFIKYSAYRDDIKLVVSKSQRGGYKLVSTSLEALEIKQHPSLTFVHPSKFMGVSETLNGALLAGYYLIKGANI